MADFSDFHPIVRLEATDAPLPIIDNAILRAATEFCRRTGIWIEEQDPISTIIDEIQYDLEPPTDSIVDRLLSVVIDGAAIGSARTQDLDKNISNWRTADSGPPANYYFDTPDILSLRPAPDKVYTIAATMVLRPSSDATTLPDLLLRYDEAIGFGAITRLLEMGGKSWSNPNGAISYKGQFEREITNTGAKANKRHTVSSLTAAPVFFA